VEDSNLVVLVSGTSEAVTAEEEALMVEALCLDVSWCIRDGYSI